MRQNAAEPEQEVKRLQRCISDLVSVLALPAACNNSEPSRILETFLDALIKLLDLNFLYAQARVASHKAPIEMFRIADSNEVCDSRYEIRQALRQWLGEDTTDHPAIRRLMGAPDISILPLQLGIEGSLGLIVVGCQRLDFPQQTERLVMTVAANQIAIMLQQAQLMSEQRRVAQELDERVAQRTSELAAANQELRIEIAERKEIEERLRESERESRRNEEFLKEAQRLTLSGCFSWCVDNDEVSCSEEALRIYGFEPDTKVTIQRLAGSVHPDDRPVLAEKVREARGSGGNQDYGIRLQMPDGSVKYLRVSSQETRGESGRREYIGAIQDVTARHIDEEALSMARADLAHISRVTSLSALTASIAHEINQPLSGIITNANTCLRMLDSVSPNVDGARETARRTLRDGNRVSEVIVRLRTLFNRKEVVAEAVDLSEAAREVVALSMSELQRSGVFLQNEFADNLPIVKGDRIQLQQVILNLLRNALDAMGNLENPSKRLAITTEKDGEQVRVMVKDSGIGFEPAVADRLFEPFYTTKRGGMGIGLSVSRSIVEAHGGRMWAKANDGPGATFAFSIPCNHSQNSGKERGSAKVL